MSLPETGGTIFGIPVQPDPAAPSDRILVHPDLLAKIETQYQINLAVLIPDARKGDDGPIT